MTPKAKVTFKDDPAELRRKAELNGYLDQAISKVRNWPQLVGADDEAIADAAAGLFARWIESGGVHRNLAGDLRAEDDIRPLMRRRLNGRR